MSRRTILSSPRELVVVTRTEAQLFTTTAAFEAAPGVDTAPLAGLLAREEASIRPLFGVPRAASALARAAPASTRAHDHGLDRFHHVYAPDHRLDGLARQLRALPIVEAAYVRPGAEVAFWPGGGDPPSLEEPPAVTPDFSDHQAYLGSAPGGIEARHAWSLAGGRGREIRVIDIQFGWLLHHESLIHQQGGLVLGVSTSDDDQVHHGTAAAGLLGAGGDESGVTGICPDAFLRMVALPTEGQTTPLDTGRAIASRIHDASARLKGGDILVLALHSAGPRHPGDGQQHGYIALEWWPDTLAAIRHAASADIIVVEAAGNGGVDLDHRDHDVPATGFPSGWRNPFNPAHHSSGAVLVGAGAPPPGTHGRDWGPDRSRLAFSNYGGRVDAQGWGCEVTTCGYGDIQRGHDPRRWYTDRFSGTSSAALMVAGAIASLQGVLRAKGRPPLGPEEVRALLRTTGSPQQDGLVWPSTQRIGNRPNLRDMLDRLS
ncbi:S8 family serine peptidase [Sorangium sp. So ce119]|uniref:S8 family serine peptidase n=1 Tax=Sorangium sp. So ce119 TaxID=3133279 RepID=UPI003F626D68